MMIIPLRARSGECAIALGESVGKLRGYCGRAERIVAIVDSNVLRLHGPRLGDIEIIEAAPGEGNKTLGAIERVYRSLLELEADRSAFVVGIGGGIACDIAGFAASTYMRGLRFGFVPTTLLAMVDASVGGKNGVNFMGYKNIIGTIRQPEFCLCDFELLETLPESEMRNGLAEAVKSAAIGDAGFFSYLEGGWKDALSRKGSAVERVVHDSLRVKIGIVEADETEKGERMKLNFGHTIGHAVEKAAGIPHGEAISIGMMAAAGLSVKRAGLPERDAERLGSLLKSIGLPTGLGSRKGEVLDAIRKDKKRAGGKIRMALLEGIGSARIADVGLSEMEAVVDDMC